MGGKVSVVFDSKGGESVRAWGGKVSVDKSLQSQAFPLSSVITTPGLSLPVVQRGRAISLARPCIG